MRFTNTLTRTGIGRLTAALIAALTLTACEEGQDFSLFKPKPETETTTDSQATTLVERDVEAPDVFSATEAAARRQGCSTRPLWLSTLSLILVAKEP